MFGNSTVIGAFFFFKKEEGRNGLTKIPLVSGCVWVSFFIDSIKKRFSSSEKISLSKNGVFYGFYFPRWSLRIKYCPVVLCLGQTKYVSTLISISVFSMPWGVLLKKKCFECFLHAMGFCCCCCFFCRVSGVSQK